jgi:hypothetical protein
MLVKGLPKKNKKLSMRRERLSNILQPQGAKHWIVAKCINCGPNREPLVFFAAWRQCCGLWVFWGRGVVRRIVSQSPPCQPPSPASPHAAQKKPLKTLSTKNRKT